MKKALPILLLAVACASPAPPRAPRPEVVPTATTTIVYVTASALNVRSEPSTKSDVVTQVRRGEKLELVEPGRTAWLHVRTAAGRDGWVAAQHVSTTKPPRRRNCPDDTDFRFIESPTPSFSQEGPHGLVVVEANVDASGIVRSTKVISNTTGNDALAAKAEREIRAARFAPPIRDCVPRAFVFTYKRSF